MFRSDIYLINVNFAPKILARGRWHAVKVLAKNYKVYVSYVSMVLVVVCVVGDKFGNLKQGNLKLKVKASIEYLI